jgi:hypothetical protein
VKDRLSGLSPLEDPLADEIVKFQTGSVGRNTEHIGHIRGGDNRSRNRREDVLNLLGYNGLGEPSIALSRASLTAVLLTRTHPSALSLRNTRPFNR